MEFVRKNRKIDICKEFVGIENIIGKENTELIVKRVGYMMNRIDHSMFGGSLERFEEGYDILNQDYSFNSVQDEKNFYNAKVKYESFLDMLSNDENNLNI